MGAQRIYDRLVKQWGRDLANEIWAKRATKPPKKRLTKARGKSADILDSRARLPGSFEAGGRR